MAVAACNSNLYFFGGVGAAGTESILDVSADMWCFDTTSLTWREITHRTPWPSPRRCVGFSGSGNQLFLWGGSGIVSAVNSKTRYNFLNDFWAFDTTSETWALLAESEDHLFCPGDEVRPAPRYTPVFQIIGDKKFLFGGYTEDRLGKRKLNDAWMLREGVWSTVFLTANQGYRQGADFPGVRYGCMSASNRKDVFVCGGFSDDGDHIDVWRFDSERGNWELLSEDVVQSGVPPARYCAAFAYHEGRLFLFGGRSRRYPKINFNDFWIFDLKNRSWSLISDNQEQHSYSSEAIFPAYHAKASSIVSGSYWYLWGGEGVNGHVSDFWRYGFESNEWQLIQSARSDDPRFW